ncbi:hypothetical protein PC128_g15851 [Phytophthora cactorum]|nr:hypothetical protein PC120_g5230 [Phytophthora cactorum]KAG3089522.1 hypothetical protein PC121_g4301 [Phytophthora cactorum]KAG3179615.1 hypothetical protein PC128_g15851 [Phytophthora cactorum]KAG4053440.1 hypothetical protein PC123_g11412 [Phytophthora cactorum]
MTKQRSTSASGYCEPASITRSRSHWLLIEQASVGGWTVCLVSVRPPSTFATVWSLAVVRSRPHTRGRDGPGRLTLALEPACAAPLRRAECCHVRVSASFCYL